MCQFQTFHVRKGCVSLFLLYVLFLKIDRKNICFLDTRPSPFKSKHRIPLATCLLKTATLTWMNLTMISNIPKDRDLSLSIREKRVITLFGCIGKYLTFGWSPMNITEHRHYDEPPSFHLHPRLGLANNNVGEKDKKGGGGTNNQTFHTSNKIKQTGFHIE